MTSPIAGAWELVSDTEQGLFIFTETHFTELVVRSRTQWPAGTRDSEATDEMRLEAWARLRFALGGTYEVVSSSGSVHEFVFHPIISRTPIPLRDIAHAITIEGDTMSAEIGGNREVWRRVASN